MKKSILLLLLWVPMGALSGYTQLDAVSAALNADNPENDHLLKLEYLRTELSPKRDLIHVCYRVENLSPTTHVRAFVIVMEMKDLSRLYFDQWRFRRDLAPGEVVTSHINFHIGKRSRWVPIFDQLKGHKDPAQLYVMSGSVKVR